MSKGYSMLSKELMDSEEYFSERFTRMQAYIDLCLLAAWKDRKFMKRGQVVDLKAGQLAKSEEELASRWKWSRNTVRKYLNEQQIVGNIEQQKSRLITIITVKFGLNIAQQIEQQQEDIYKDNKDIKEEESNDSKKKLVYPQEYENDFILYGRKGSKKNGFKRWKELTEEEKIRMRLHIPYYLQSNDRQFLKDFEGYINQRMFESPVYQGSILLYDPMQCEQPEGYHPLTDNCQIWDEKDQCLRIFNGDIDNLNDGYTDDNRPEGATVAWGMYSWKWIKLRKEWVKQ